MAIELVMGRKNREMDRENGDHPKVYGPSQEGQEVQAVRRYIKKNQIQDYGSISEQLTDSLSTEPKA